MKTTRPFITDRQREILSLLAQGHSQIEASELTEISPRSFRRTLTRAVRLLEARSPVQAVAIAAQLGMLGDEHLPPRLRTQ